MKSEIDELVYEWVDIEEVSTAPADSKSSCDEDVVDQDYSRCHIFLHPSPDRDPRVYLRPKGKDALRGASWYLGKAQQYLWRRSGSNLEVDYEKPGKIVIWFLRTGRFLAGFFKRVSRILFGIHLQNRRSFSKSTSRTINFSRPACQIIYLSIYRRAHPFDLPQILFYSETKDFR